MLSFDTNREFIHNYKILIGSILPRPIAAVSTLNEDGSNNLAPFSFFTAVSAQPMIIAFCPLIRTSDGRQKDTPRNILRSKEFVVNIVSEEMAEKINHCSQELPYGEDEFQLSGLTPLESHLIQPKRIKESLIHFECRFRDQLSYGNQVGSGQLITGEVLKIHVSGQIYDEGRIITSKLKPVGRGSGSDWFKCTHSFQMERPKSGFKKS